MTGSMLTVKRIYFMASIKQRLCAFMYWEENVMIKTFEVAMVFLITKVIETNFYQ